MPRVSRHCVVLFSLLLWTAPPLTLSASQIVYQVLPVTLLDDDANEYAVSGSITTDGSSFALESGALSAVVDYQIGVTGPTPYHFSPSNPGAAILADRGGDGGARIEFEATSTKLMVHHYGTAPDQQGLRVESNDARLWFGIGWGPPARVFYSNWSSDPVRAGAEVSDSRTMVIAVVPQIGDCCLDGDLNANDLTCVATVTERDVVLVAIDSVPGDLDGNGHVEFADFLVLAVNFGREIASYSEGNVNLAGGVEWDDFLKLASNFGYSKPDVPEAVAEPNALRLVSMGAAMLTATYGMRRRRRPPVSILQLPPLETE